jgi:hypothetical protein
MLSALSNRSYSAIAGAISFAAAAGYLASATGYL